MSWIESRIKSTELYIHLILFQIQAEPKLMNILYYVQAWFILLLNKLKFVHELLLKKQTNKQTHTHTQERGK